jgi:RNA polymerase sigma factor (sigma-70 family)
VTINKKSNAKTAKTVKAVGRPKKTTQATSTKKLTKTSGAESKPAGSKKTASAKKSAPEVIEQVAPVRRNSRTKVIAPLPGEEMVPAELKGTAEWSDMNKRMFIQRIEIKKRIDKLEASKNKAAKRRELSRAKRDYEDLTMRIVEANYGLLRKYVKLFTGSASREDARDFEAAGRLGLMRAIDNYDPYRGSFAQWAFKPIQREVLRAVHSADHNNMNPGDFERRPEILRALKKLQGENEEVKPTEAQVAAEAGVTIEQVKRVLHAPRMDSLHTPVGDADGAVLSDLIEDKGGALEDVVISAIGVESLTNYGLSALDAREYFVLSRRLGLDCEPEQRLSAIGEMLKLSREAVRQIEAKAIAKMSHPVLLRLLVRNGKQ